MDIEVIESHDSTSLSPCTPPTSSLFQKRKAGRKKFRETRHPVYRGVRQRNGKKWVCEIREPKTKLKSRIWVGTYPTPEMAARAHDVAVLALSGTSAKFNFPDSVPLLPLAKSRSALHIREAASTIPKPNESERMFFDEEAVYNMPALLDSMAEGLLITPPSMETPTEYSDVIDLTLWTN